MAVKVGINGFGRVGRLAARILGSGHPNLELAAINSRLNHSNWRICSNTTQCTAYTPQAWSTKRII